jgi:hypothetical protein
VARSAYRPAQRQPGDPRGRYGEPGGPYGGPGTADAPPWQST